MAMPRTVSSRVGLQYRFIEGRKAEANSLWRDCIVSGYLQSQKMWKVNTAGRWKGKGLLWGENMD